MSETGQNKSEFNPGKPILFISDVHIGGFSKSKEQYIEQDLLSLIDYADNNGYAICVLGDLFDFWMEYPNKRPSIGKKVLDRFARFNKKNTSSLYITGNHDNWVYNYFEKCGFDVDGEYRILKIENKSVLLMHGDGVEDEFLELPRPYFHRILRNPKFVFIFRHLLPPSLGIATTKWFSRFNRTFNEKSEKECTPFIDDWAKRMLAEQKFDVIICGHHHYPRFINVNNGLYINLGNFFNDRTLAIYNNEGFQLVKWHGLNQKIERLYPL
ncbi:MAG TPA: UDP-2,3-diacylglucosamine diphosphatase [Balneolales bacterium]|nr:UDP-2,3-diacylglucosamine diphosphatase [Balneolales bacterium]